VSLARQNVDRPSPGGAAPAGAPALGELAGARHGDGVACAACRAFVADNRARISVDGSHSHSFINPAGLIFRVSCFAAAPGVAPVGDEERYFTWFAGFAWRVGLCRACGAHLGWSYRRVDSVFVALIDDRVVEGRAPGEPPASS
jgi:hypothetical protein